ncbi:MAG: thermonuclease family protein [Methanotrichaceae archaeon]|nr:thermonuclease family protein [Methanotrichaceae archaeon]
MPILALAAPDEMSGIVTYVVDGNTFDLRVEKTDPRILYEIERVRLADVDSPEMSTPEGEPAKAFTTEYLLGKTVWLDIDNRSVDGRDMYDRLIAVVYLEDAIISTNTSIMSKETALDYFRLMAGDEPEHVNVFINLTHPFNRILVDSGYAVINDFTNNEFVPSDWWAEGVSQSESGQMADTTEGQFVGSTQSNKYHYPSCVWAEKILPQNRIWFSSSEDARLAGYVPCGVCKPP